MKTINKIRKMLGNRFHLSVESDGTEIVQWMLFRNYENGDPIYWSNDNKPIMRSEENTIAELYDFAKSHQKLDLAKIILKSNFWILTVVLVICFANFYLKSDILRGVVITADVIVLLTDLIIHIVSNKNHKVNMRELSENWVRKMQQWFPEDKELKIEIADVKPLDITKAFEDTKKIEPLEDDIRN